MCVCVCACVSMSVCVYVYVCVYKTESLCCTLETNRRLQTNYRLVFRLVLVAQSCPTLCNPTDWSLPDSSVHGILQARILEKVAISFDLPDTRIELRSRALQAASLSTEPPGKPTTFQFFFKKISCYVPGAWHIQSFIPTRQVHRYPHFTDEKTEAQSWND